MSLGSKVIATCSADVANHVTRHCDDRGGKSLSNGLDATSLALTVWLLRHLLTGARLHSVFSIETTVRKLYVNGQVENH